MTYPEIAATLHAANLQYGERLDDALVESAKTNRIVIVFGASDDLMEFRGAVYDEIGAYGGTTAYITSSGLLTNECENDECPYHAKERAAAKTIKAIFGENAPNATWRYETTIPHATFNIYEDGEIYCVGIVFGLDGLGV